MFTISVETHFKASHKLNLPDGSKEPAHYHDWVVTAEVSSKKLNNMAIVMNFQKLKQMLDNIVSNFHNTALNKLRYFGQNNPSAENVARYIFEKLDRKLPKELKLENVKVVEEPGCWAKFSKLR
jgi:6-pyruvoyltetrahydropterin/6-carboxytetrahydropterin synthase